MKSYSDGIAVGRVNVAEAIRRSTLRSTHDLLLPAVRVAHFTERGVFDAAGELMRFCRTVLLGDVAPTKIPQSDVDALPGTGFN